MITLSHLSRIPIYQQIIDQVLAQIASGILPSHTQMPTVRSLAKELGINPNTVVKAYNELEHAGYLYAKAGVGSFVSEDTSMDESILRIRLDECRKEIHLLRNLGVKKERLFQLIEDEFNKERNT